LAGVVLARALRDVADVSVFEKARGVGGRMASRYAPPYYFDHGTQCFTARTPEFQAFLAPLMARGVIAEWSGKIVNLEIGKRETKRLWFEPHWVASPNMNGLCKALAEGSQVRSAVEVAPLLPRSAQGWQLQDKDGGALGVFDWVISTAPPLQTVRLFDRYLPEDAPVRRAVLQGCFALMVGLNRPWDKRWIAAKVRDNPIKWLSVNSTKPGRDPSVSCLVAHSRHDWAEEHMEADMGWVQQEMLAQLEAVSGIDMQQADYVSAHRWRYAIVDQAVHSGFYCDEAQHLAAVSDWGATSRIEEVWMQADALARHLESRITAA
jgi:predicted NAD/FAD-dependent oxidoreductase